MYILLQYGLRTLLSFTVYDFKRRHASKSSTYHPFFHQYTIIWIFSWLSWTNTMLTVNFLDLLYGKELKTAIWPVIKEYFLPPWKYWASIKLWHYHPVLGQNKTAEQLVLKRFVFMQCVYLSRDPELYSWHPWILIRLALDKSKSEIYLHKLRYHFLYCISKNSWYYFSIVMWLTCP